MGEKLYYSISLAGDYTCCASSRLWLRSEVQPLYEQNIVYPQIWTDIFAYFDTRRTAFYEMVCITQSPKAYWRGCHLHRASNRQSGAGLKTQSLLLHRIILWPVQSYGTHD